MKPVIRSVALALLLALVVAPSASAPAAAVDRQIALGIAEINYQDLSGADAYLDTYGRYPAIWTVWNGWGGDAAFPTDLMNGLQTRGIVPMVNWEPTDNSNDCTKWSNANIIRGDFDSYITQWATDAKNYGGRIILRFAHEMNGYWFIWGNGRCTNTPNTLKLMWRHVWQIFQDVGATNVQFLWSVGATRLGRLRTFYPGDAYVDYVGLSAFNWGPPGHAWTTMVRTFKKKVNAVSLVSTKPIIAAEVGGAYLPNCAVCDKPAYISAGYPAVYAKWPRLAAIVYFDIDMTTIAPREKGQKDWRLINPPSAVDAYRAIVQDPRFQGLIP